MHATVGATVSAARVCLSHHLDGTSTTVTGWGWDVCTGRIARSAVLYLILLDRVPILLALAQGRFETLVPDQTPSDFPIE